MSIPRDKYLVTLHYQWTDNAGKLQQDTSTSDELTFVEACSYPLQFRIDVPSVTITEVKINRVIWSGTVRDLVKPATFRHGDHTGTLSLGVCNTCGQWAEDATRIP